MWIKNVKILTEQRKFLPGVIQIDGDRIKNVMLAEADRLCASTKDRERVIDGKGGYLFAGMIDMHFHGAAGWDFCDGTVEALKELARFEASVGVTAICPATMTLPKESLFGILANARDFRDYQKKNPDDSQADLVGINMEGPFISPKKSGAQDSRFILPRSSKDYFAFQEAAGGMIKVIAVAPEEQSEESVEEFISQVGNSAVVSLAHTNASYTIARDAFEKGASHVVHLFNAMPRFYHREPGVVGAALDDSKVTVELICDGIHIHPSVIRLIHSLKKENMILISDSMRATSLPDGSYTLGGQDVVVTRNKAVLQSDGALAGSVTTLPDCVRYAVQVAGLPLEDAIYAATFAPAKRLGIEKEYGSVKEGKLAELVLWDEELRLQMVMHHGVVCQSFS